SYSTESLAHALFPGLVAAALLGLPLLVGGAVGVLAAAIAIAFVGRIPLVERDTGVAVVITSLFGLGVVLALSPSSPPGLESLLFGDLLGVTRGDLVISGVLVAATGLPPMMGLAIVFAWASAIAGLYASYYLDIAAGAAVASATVATFLIAALVGVLRGTWSSRPAGLRLPRA